MKDYKFAVEINGKKLNCIYVWTEYVAEQCRRRLLERSTPVLGFDIETGKKLNYRDDPAAGLDPRRSFPSLLQFYDGIDSVYLFDTLRLPIKIFQDIFTEKRVIAHNAVFDLQHMMHAGIEDVKIDCSMIQYSLVRCAEFASFEEEQAFIEEEWGGYEGEGQALDFLTARERFGEGLRAVTAKLLGIRIDKDYQTSDWTNRPLSKDQLLYAVGDSWCTYEIGKILSEKIINLGLHKVYRLNRRALYPTCRMILNGCHINAEKHRADCIRWGKRKDALHVQLLKMLGSNANLRSVPQVSAWLERTLPIKYQHRWPRSEKTGKMKTDARTLTLFSHLPFVAPYLEFKKLEKLRGTYGEPMLEKVSPITGRLHGSFTLAYTATGRQSSRNPNMQNIPRFDKNSGINVKSVFDAEPGNILLSADYGTMEMRTAAELSRDRVMLKAIASGIDLHKFMASIITGRKVESIGDKDPDRQLAKSLNFGLLFGLGAKGLVDYANWNYGVKLERSQADEYYAKFFDTYSGYEAWQRVQRERCMEAGNTTTRLGKLRRLQRDRGYTRSVNHPVQGSAAEVVITALCKLDDTFQRTRSRAKIINLVHDEILVECPKNEAKNTSRSIKIAMEEAMLELFPKASLTNLVGVKQGNTWAETK